MNQENRKEKKRLHQCQRGKNLERVAVTIANQICLFFAPAAAAKKLCVIVQYIEYIRLVHCVSVRIGSRLSPPSMKIRLGYNLLTSLDIKTKTYRSRPVKEF